MFFFFGGGGEGGAILLNGRTLDSEPRIPGFNPF